MHDGIRPRLRHALRVRYTRTPLGAGPARHPCPESDGLHLASVVEDSQVEGDRAISRPPIWFHHALLTHCPETDGFHLADVVEDAQVVGVVIVREVDDRISLVIFEGASKELERQISLGPASF